MEVRKIARRAAGRALAAHGGAPSGQRLAGINVRLEACDQDSPRPLDARSAEEAERRRRASGGRPLVTAQCLAKTPDGGEFPVPREALVTDLAHDEAKARGIRLVDELFRARRIEPDPSRGGRPCAAIGSDHGGFALKADVAAWLHELGWEPLDFGTHDENSCDYPDYAQAVARAVASGRAQVGVMIDGAGIGSAMAANKIEGCLAANCWDERTARNAREHNHANVLTLGAGGLSRAQAHDVLRAFLSTPFGGDRHARRVAKIHVS